MPESISNQTFLILHSFFVKNPDDRPGSGRLVFKSGGSPVIARL